MSKDGMFKHLGTSNGVFVYDTAFVPSERTTFLRLRSKFAGLQSIPENEDLIFSH